MSKKNAVRLIETGQDLNPYEALVDHRHQAAVDMRVDGYRIRYIAEELKLGESTVKNWFMRGGPCHDAYHFRRQQWADETAKLFDSIHDEIKSGAADAIVTLKQAARNKSILAAIKLLEFAGFQPVEKPATTLPTAVTIEYVNPPSPPPALDGPRTSDPVPTDPETT